MNKELRNNEHDNLPIEIQDAIDDLEQRISNLKQAISCIQTAVQSDTEDSGNYIEGVLSVLLLAVKDLADKVHLLAYSASEGN